MFCVTDTPGKPEVLDVTKNSVTLVWTRPKNDGGSKIIGYYVEAMRVPGDTWIRCNTSSQNIPREEYTVSGLERDLQYQFRVIAKTAVNMSKPSEPTDPVLVCAENGERISFNSPGIMVRNRLKPNYLMDHQHVRCFRTPPDIPSVSVYLLTLTSLQVC